MHRAAGGAAEAGDLARLTLPAPLVDFHRKNNRSTAGSWEGFAAHRARVTQLAAAAGRGSLMVLGAGNCNDLDLAALADPFQHIHLVDVDRDALDRAREACPPAVRDRLVLHAPVDLSGALPRLGAWGRRDITAPELATLPGGSADAVVAALGITCDVVLSACFLSQLMRTNYVALGPQHEGLHVVAAALAVGHLRALTRLTAPGGTSVLVTDMTSSETYPLEELWDQQPPAALLAHLDETDNAFAGTAPSFVSRILREDAVVTRLASAPTFVDPWLWRFDDERTYLVYAAAWRRI